MICPDCGHDNIDGDDLCDACGQPLVNIDLSPSEVEQTITRETIKSLAPHVPISIEPATTVREAIQKLVENRIGCLLVKEGDELVGIFTERDVLNRISENPRVMDQPIQDFMTKSPTTARLDDSIAYALHAMDLGGYRHLPIVNADGKPKGIISIRDILGYLCDRFAELSPVVPGAKSRRGFR
jgi:CBS domain-containing protein